MSVRDKNVAVRRDQHIARLIERVGPVSRDSRLAERQQHFSVLAELENLVALPIFGVAIRDPHIVVFIYKETMRPHNHPRAKAFHQIARRIEFQNGREVRFGAGSSAAPFDDPDAFAVAIDVRADHLSPRPPLGQLRPVLDRAIRIGRGIRIGLGECLCTRHPAHNHGRDSQREDDAFQT